MRSSVSDVRIADFSRILAGPMATMVLADLGADVITIERPGAGDDTRNWEPPYDARGAATYFSAITPQQVVGGDRSEQFRRSG
jgi:crotonobetainyl-CoA:carnitine CoA-transferase CaiB-like acyl-CoA transferase